MENSYLDKMADHEVLSADEERELFIDYEAGKQAAQALETTGEELSSTQKQILQSQIDTGVLARQTIIEKNQRLVISIAKTYTSKAQSMALDDLIQEGNLGLMRAVEKFDYRQGFKFYTYAQWWVRNKVLAGLADRDRLIRLPSDYGEDIRAIRESEEYFLNIGIKPTDAQIAQHSGFELNQVIELKKHDIYAQSTLDEPVQPGSYASKSEFMAADEMPEQEFERVLEGLNAQYVVSCLKTVLSEKEYDIFVRRTALEQTQLEISHNYGISGRRIGVYEQRARDKVKAIELDHSKLI